MKGGNPGIKRQFSTVFFGESRGGAFFICFFVSLLIYFCCYRLGEALRAGVRGFTVESCILI